MSEEHQSDLFSLDTVPTTTPAVVHHWADFFSQGTTHPLTADDIADKIIKVHEKTSGKPLKGVVRAEYRSVLLADTVPAIQKELKRRGHNGR